MTEITGEFDDRAYAYRCATCLGVMVFKVEGATAADRGSYCPACKTLGGGFWFPVVDTPEPLPPPTTLWTKVRWGKHWRWQFGDLLEWNWLLRRA